MTCSRPHGLLVVYEVPGAAQPFSVTCLSTRRPVLGSAVSMASRWGPLAPCGGRCRLWPGFLGPRRLLSAEVPSPMLLLTLQLLGDLLPKHLRLF